MLHTNGRYWVDVGPQGEIRVKVGDWLSKYSAAIHNDFFHIFEYARRDPASASPIPIPRNEVDLIIAGWTLFHLPTYYESFPGVAVTATPLLTDADKKKMTEDALKVEFGIKGDNLPLLSRAIDIVGHVETAASLAEIAGIIAEGGAAAGAGTALTWAGIVLFPVGGATAWANALEFGFRLAALRAVAYGRTAWAYDDPMPAIPGKILDNIRASRLDPSWDLAETEKAWNQARDTAVKELDDQVKKKGWQKANYQRVIRALADTDNRKRVAWTIMKGMETLLREGAPRDAFWSPEPDYPN